MCIEIRCHELCGCHQVFRQKIRQKAQGVALVAGERTNHIAILEIMGLFTFGTIIRCSAFALLAIPTQVREVSSFAVEPRRGTLPVH